MTSLRNKIRRYLDQRAVLKARINENAKCPGCGHMHGRIEFSERDRVILHHCLICGARWGEKTVLMVDSWLKKPETNGIKRIV